MNPMNETLEQVRKALAEVVAGMRELRVDNKQLRKQQSERERDASSRKIRDCCIRHFRKATSLRAERDEARRERDRLNNLLAWIGGRLGQIDGPINIVQAENAIADYADAIRADSESRLDKLVKAIEAVEAYHPTVYHLINCSGFVDGESRCNCGLQEAQTALFTTIKEVKEES